MSMDTKSRLVGFKERVDFGVKTLHVDSRTNFNSPEIQLSENAMQSQGLGRFNRQMSLWPLSLESYGPCIKRLGH